ncbi:hypothetical protein, partial [Thauera terpenica]|uniref:hypothetical protein n=1 Tax=Thauera terpenica TaxID=76113 RepID=UPI001C3F37C7
STGTTDQYESELVITSNWTDRSRTIGIRSRPSRERGMQAFQVPDKIGVQAVAKRCEAFVEGCRSPGGRHDFGHPTFGVAGTLQQRSAELAIVLPGLATQAGKFIGRKHGLHLAPATLDERNHLIRVDHCFRP